ILAAYGLFTFCIYFVDFIFYDELSIHFQDTQAMAAFLGLFYAVSGLVNLCAQGFLSAWFLNRFGVKSGLQVLPGTLLLSTTALVLVGAPSLFGSIAWATAAVFGSALLSKFAEKVLGKAFQEPAVRILYQPLPTEQRVTMQAVVEGMAGPVFAGLAGAALLAGTLLTIFTALQASVVLVLVLVPWIAITVALGRNYGRFLQQSLTRRRLNVSDLSADDGST